MNTVTLTKNITVTEECDVLVCGAGAAGWIAAVSAARSGFRTILVDKYGFAGGTAVSDYVLPISGYYLNKACCPTDERIPAVSDLPMEFARRLEKMGAAIFEFPRGHISYDPETYKLLAETMLAEAGVKFITNSYISDIVRDGNNVTHVVIVNKNGTEAIAAKTVIDATGDADIFRLVGSELQPLNPDMQPMSLCFLLDGVDLETPLLKNCIHHNGAKGSHSVNPEIREYLLSCPEIDDFCGPWFNSTVTGTAVSVNITRISCNALDNRAYAAAERKLRADMFRLVDLLRKKFPEFANCQIVSSGMNAGIRETCRIKGRLTYTYEDMKSRDYAPCVVACCSHPIDIHMPHGGGQSLENLKKPALIPFGCLVSEKYPNLIAAGRCISTDSVPMASARVQATCMTMGDAAGKAVAFALKNNCNVNEADLHGFVFEDLERLKNV